MSDPEEKAPDNILEFKPRPENKPWDPKTETLATVKPMWERNEHKHGPFLVDDRERTVECKRCGKLIDPIYCIMIIAEFWHEMDWKIKVYQDIKKAEADKRAREKIRREERDKRRSAML